MYQVRHKIYGTYGVLDIDLSVEEQGYWKFETEKDAQDFINGLITDGTAREEDLIIEPFNEELNKKAIKNAMNDEGYMRSLCMECHTKGRWREGYQLHMCHRCLSKYVPNDPEYS